MTEFTCKLADIPVGVKALYVETKEFLQDYLTEEPPIFSVETCWNDVVKEGTAAQRLDKAEGREVLYSTAYLESLALYRKIAGNMLDHNVLLFHGSAVAVDGEAYLFAARSGTGKSTHARKWRELLGDRAVMVNDDKPLLRLTEDRVLVYGTPWDGKHHLSSNISVPLKAICLLVRAEENSLEPLSAPEALPFLLNQTYEASNPRALSLLDAIMHRVSLYRLHMNNLVDGAAETAYEGMR